MKICMRKFLNSSRPFFPLEMLGVYPITGGKMLHEQIIIEKNGVQAV